MLLLLLLLLKFGERQHRRSNTRTVCERYVLTKSKVTIAHGGSHTNPHKYAPHDSSRKNKIPVVLP